MKAIKEYPGYFILDSEEVVKIEKKMIVPVDKKNGVERYTLRANNINYYRQKSINTIISENPIPVGSQKVQIKGAPPFYLYSSGKIYRESEIPIAKQIKYKGGKPRTVWVFQKGSKRTSRSTSIIIKKYMGINGHVNKMALSGDLRYINGSDDCYIDKSGKAYRFDHKRQMWMEIARQKRKDNRDDMFLIIGANGSGNYTRSATALFREYFGETIIDEKIIGGLIPIPKCEGYYIDKEGTVYDDSSKVIPVCFREQYDPYPSCARYVNVIKDGKRNAINLDLLKLTLLKFNEFKKIEIGGKNYYLNDYGTLFSPLGKLMLPQVEGCRVVVKPAKRSVNYAKLIATHFIPNPNHYTQLVHIDGNYKNCCPANLKWISDDERKQIVGGRRKQKNASTKEDGLKMATTQFLIDYYRTFDSKILGIEFKRIDKELGHLEYWRDNSSRVFEDIVDQLSRYRIHGDLLPYAKKLAYMINKRDRANHFQLYDDTKTQEGRVISLNKVLGQKQSANDAMWI